ncbi:MAG: choice-of-anchor I family protein, partial [Pseudomonadota bacterium]
MLRRTTLSLSIAMASAFASAAPKDVSIALLPIGTYASGAFAAGAAEIVAHDPQTQTLFVINAADKTVDILDLSDPTQPSLLSTIDVALEIPASGGINSVAVHDGLVAIAVENDDKQANGWVAFYDTAGHYLNHVEAGALPDMVTFTHNGNYVLLANEGEPSSDYQTDPEGSVTIVDVSNGALSAIAVSAGFSDFNNMDLTGIRISGPGASVAEDLEPEYIATSHDSRTAWVTLQENNAIAEIDIRSATVTSIRSLGTKNYNTPGFGLDGSDRDSGINIKNWPIRGLYMPDGIAAYETKGRTFLITANEGDAREYINSTTAANCPTLPFFSYSGGNCTYLDEARISSLDLDNTLFPAPLEATLKNNANIGRLKIVRTEGNPDHDGDYEQLFTYGTRSISIWDESGAQVYDSGDTLERMTALADPANFNSSHDANNSFDTRSDDKGPEPEGVTVGKVRGNLYAFVGLERVGGVAVFDVTEPAATKFVSYTNNRDFSVGDVSAEYAGDLGPEGILFIKAEDSPTGAPLLVLGNEISGTTTVYS